MNFFKNHEQIIKVEKKKIEKQCKAKKKSMKKKRRIVGRKKKNGNKS
jgi:hypothetical protein